MRKREAPTLVGDLLTAIAAVEDRLWIQYGCCERRKVVIDAVLPVISAWIGRIEAPKLRRPRKKNKRRKR